ncbi:MAG: TM0106 family RecB-like putative nuclease [Vulcanimicrobiaceae bacterium]
MLKQRATLEAMRRGQPLIYGGRISSGELLGEPDLLRCEGGKYVPGDIKSGAGEEGSTEESKRPKKHYAVQLALYVDVLERMGFSDGQRRAFVWDIHGEEVPYDFVAPKGPKTPDSLWGDYQACLQIARGIISGIRNPGAAYHGECKHCVWYSACIQDLEAKDDLTLLPGLGRKMREPFLDYVANSRELAAASVERFLDPKGKSILRGVGPDSIVKFYARAKLRMSRGAPYLKAAVTLPRTNVELFFDIETDPMSDHCYLHGFVVRRGESNESEQYFGFFAPTPDAAGEREAFTAAWDFIRKSMPCVIYIYSKYERTWWRCLQQKYPDVCSAAEIEALFADDVTVDLLQIVQSSTEWPTRDHSIKTLAGYLGFSWRDSHPSGAASIEWYDRYRSGEEAAKPRILDYNEDDCRSMRVLLDGIRALDVRTV